MLGADGVYEVRTSPVGQVCARIEAGLELADGFYPALPPCPASLLGRTVEIFKERPKVEALITLVYDTEEGCYHIVWQGDDADGHSVEYVPLIGDERHVVVGEIHSHHAMEPFFSRTDDRSERRLGVYGVIGHIGHDRPTALFRFPCGTLPSGRTRFLPLRAERLFSPAAEVWSIVEQYPTLAGDGYPFEVLQHATH